MIVKNKPNKDFTTLRNGVMNLDMSLAAKGLWAYLMTKPDNWQTSVSGLTVQCQEGRDAIRRILRELEDNGLFKRIEIRQGGKFHYEDFVYDTPQKRPPLTEKPSTVEPYTENPTQVNTNKVKDTKVSSSSKRELLISIISILKGSATTKLTAGRLDKLSARCKTFTTLEILQAAQNLSENGWMMGENNKGVKYATIDYFLRNDEIVAKWYEAAAKEEGGISWD